MQRLAIRVLSNVPSFFKLGSCLATAQDFDEWTDVEEVNFSIAINISFQLEFTPRQKINEG